MAFDCRSNTVLSIYVSSEETGYMEKRKGGMLWIVFPIYCEFDISGF